jgi:hypothetical protein
MYVFERAYVDFAARVRDFFRRLASAGGGVWHWFWDGRGADAIEVLLRLGIVASAVAMAALYLRYENAQGRGFSAGTFGAIAVILLYVTVLLWGWKAPVHFLARVLSGAAAAGTLLLSAAVALSIAVFVFTLYLIGLVVFTAASFLIFIPIRVGQEIWLLYRRIAYHCPYDDCPYKGLPIHICGCGERYTDLLPSFYGLLHHTCRHSDEDVKLPTLDILGRKKLARLCGGCKRPLIHSSLGEMQEWPIAVVGGASAGKTVFLVQATRQLLQVFAKAGGTAQIDAHAQQEDLERHIDRLDHGQVLAKTAGDVMTALGVAVRMPKGIRRLLYLYDAPGEDFASMKRFGQKQFIQHLRGIVLLVDPFSLPSLAEHGRRAKGDLKPSETPFRHVVDNLIHNVNLMLLRRTDDTCAVPVAVVLSKSDAFPDRDFPFLANLVAPNGHLDEATSRRCREALDKLGEGGSIRALEQKFTNLRYFACSALGRIPVLSDPSAFRPTGVVQPFQWLVQSGDGGREKRAWA